MKNKEKTSHKELYLMYKELFEFCVEELKIERNWIDKLLSTLATIRDGSNDSTIKEVARIAIDSYHIDKILNNRKLCETIQN